MTDAQYEISIQPGYILVEDPPDYEVVWAEQPAKLQAIAAACAESGCRKVLIRGSKAKVKLTPMQVYSFGEAVGKLGLTIAVVTNHDASTEDSEFLENVATNRGSPVRIFDKEQLAREWLGV